MARASGGRTLLYAWDAQGNVSQQLDASTGNIVGSYMFDAFGTRGVSSSDPTAPNDPYSGFGGSQGYYTDVETGLQLLGHRYYDPSTGRFLNRDPLHYAATINLYEYVGNAPLNAHDFTGLNTEVIPFPIGDAGGGELGSSEGGGENPFKECLGDVGKIIAQIGDGEFGECPLNSLCQLALNCGIAIAASRLGLVQSCKGFIADPPLMFACACIIGALIAGLHTLADQECNNIACKTDTPVDPCKLFQNGAGGCLDGILSILDASWLESIAAGIMEGIGEKMCDKPK